MSVAKHILAIGASGMLRFAVLELARQGYTVSLLARHNYRMKPLSAASNGLPGSILPLQADYTHDAELRRCISERLASVGPVSLVLSWIHSHAPAAPLAIAELTGNEAAPVPFFELRGSSAEPATVSVRLAALAACPGIRLHVVQLGHINEAGRQRWLHDEEISCGTLDAIKAAVPYYLIGEL